jgi:uncharacterized protein
MDLPVHQIPPDVFSVLAEGRGSAEATRRLIAAQHSKHVLLVRQVVESARACGHDQAGQARHAYELLAAIQDRGHGAVDAVLQHPSVGSWAGHTVRMLRDARTQGNAVPGQLAAVTAAAAIRSGSTCSVEVPVANDSVMLPSVGKIAVPGCAAPRRQVRVTVRGDQAEAAGDGWVVQIPGPPAVDQPGWQGMRSLSVAAAGRTVRILIDDLDDYRLPGSANIGGRLSTAESDRWQLVLSDAWDLLVRHHQRIADEVAVMIRVFTPLMQPPHGQVSATSRETFGSVALSAPPDACSLAVTLAHEVQHAKLSALLDVVPMTLPDDGSRYYAPWRDDPRPVSGLLQGAYAFFGVAAFWRRQRSVEVGEMAMRAHADFGRWRDAVQLVVDTLGASGRLTAAGEIFVAGMVRTLNSWAADRIPPEAAALALSAAGEHRALWRRSHHDLAVKVSGLN